MTQQATSLAPKTLTAELIGDAVTQIEHSACFRGSARHRALLKHLVERSVAGDIAALKESVIAIEVFGRPASSFDPRFDSIVRVESRRLRTRLADYHRTEGRDAVVRIELPVGSYVPVIALRPTPQHDQAASRRARDLCERGEHFLRQPLSQPTLEQALARFDEALRESPAYAPAYVGLGRAWFNLAVGWYREPAVASEHAVEALQRALALDESQATAHSLLGALHHQFQRDWPLARRCFLRGIELAPGSGFVHSAYGRHLLWRGLTEDAERELLLARQLDPQYVNTRMHLVALRLAQGRLGQAELEIDAMHDLAPNSMAAWSLRATLEMFRGDAEAALRYYQRAHDCAPTYPSLVAALAGAYGAVGQFDRADETMRELQQRFGIRAASPYVLAIFAVRCGRHDEAIARLEQGLDERDPNSAMIPVDVSLYGLHGHPCWPELVAAARRPASTTGKVNEKRQRKAVEA